MTYGQRGYCTYLHGEDAKEVRHCAGTIDRLSICPYVQVQDAERSPSLHSLVEAWLERTPFVEFGDFTFWQARASPALYCAPVSIVRVNCNHCESSSAAL